MTFTFYPVNYFIFKLVAKQLRYDNMLKQQWYIIIIVLIITCIIILTEVHGTCNTNNRQ